MGICYLSSVAFIPVTVAAVMFYTYPVLIVLASPLVDGKPPLPRRCSASSRLALAGVVLVLGPGLDSLDPRGLALALLARASPALSQFFAAAALRRRGRGPAKIFWVHVIVLPAALAAAVATGGAARPRGTARSRRWRWR